MARTRAKAMGRKESGNFLRVPCAVLESSNFRALSAKSKALILDIGARFTGYNNGDLAAPWSWMKRRGWRSKDTLQAALVELRRFGMIELTRQGGLHGPSLYAYTWVAITDSHGKLDVPPTSVASNKWKQPPTEIRSPPRRSVQSDPIVGAGTACGAHAPPRSSGP